MDETNVAFDSIYVDLSLFNCIKINKKKKQLGFVKNKIEILSKNKFYDFFEVNYCRNKIFVFILKINSYVNKQ